MKIKALKDGFKAELENVAADKSISHRFAIFALLSDKTSTAKNYLLAEDTLNTLKIIENLGAKVERNGSEVCISPSARIKEPTCILECGNSGTAMRLMIGFLAGVAGFFVLSGDKYLNKRPMKRICEPLREIGAKIMGREDANFAPICIEGQKLKNFNYISEISSAQVKTAMILAGFRADKISYFKESFLSRNHSENMLSFMEAPLKIKQTSLEISPLKKPLKPLNITIPNDPSSAFYFILAALILPNSQICIKNVLLNPTRIEAYKVLEKMGANISYKFDEKNFEQIGTIYASSSKLQAIEVSENIPWLIDEAPALAIAFALANGTSVLKNAKELRVKESDRIKAMITNLQKCGIEAEELEDGFKITGGTPKSTLIESFGDHRIAMSFAILGLVCSMEIDDCSCIATSFPNFIALLENLGAQIDY
ncbi:3-phosphoshikimate 1-carboxyvinyltransferase [Campylobacter vulpis]|uniref:3-phosphoshikimate 1-carboxyvinyltransferase n=1 Tax=Campylobacter vulpis TaxID=1655500 RepID=A0A2G4QZ84_9BACT|nr:3-phosphoshikimate 1-carboxyvinyltransferase [Campylobacter vulpis]MBS4240517.1 3-phosphoshikimate 1-carboxyvinyltransferase [Campylobacter vulpis]MBS4251932.1 3-phosphoshikimate 1-carboxyvinyltransferase [Campylobacter vulpis]MBS4274934.1 3-phosphoshikimate 1-carboxyvinyltransferase [Campylobacter vulpis]MBS4281107.1 3-phosphoshikimate 1-carboxyvinyltransferase [Campylobacter vulpis]MBS4306622.1 3-phosphoshikimate 1-carboxyvinyltransferase [Campylobacter vulpis]